MYIWTVASLPVFLFLIVLIRRTRDDFYIAVLVWGVVIIVLSLLGQFSRDQQLELDALWNTLITMHYVIGIAIVIYYVSRALWPYLGATASQLHTKAFEFYEQGDLKNALRTVRQLVALAPRDPSGRYWLGQMLNQEGKFRRAIWHLSFAHQLAPASIDILKELGLAYKMRKQYAKAISIFEQVLARDPENAYAMEQLEICR